jgi:N-acetylmuramoyl-L-alanine amidase
MRTSTLSQLQEPTTIVLAGGHGADDPGAEFGSFKERDEAIKIVDLMAADLRARGVNVEIAPHEEDTQDSIRFVNERFGFGDAWVLEVHRDSASGLDPEDASLRCGVYYGTSESSKDIGEFLKAAYIRHGAHAKSWARPDTASRFGRLGWIRQTRPASHLLELGFMEGRNDDAHLRRLATIAANALFEAFTGGVSVASPGPTPAPVPAPTPVPTPTPLPMPASRRLRSRLLSGNAKLEAVASEHIELTNSSQQREEVGLVQDALNVLAGLGGNYRVDVGPIGEFRGFYGPKTRDAVQRFERDFHLTVNGIVDAETLLALDDALIRNEQGVNPIPLLSPIVSGASGYTPPAASASLFAGVDFSKGDAATGAKYRVAYAAADSDSQLAKSDPSNCRALLKFSKAVYFEAKMAICADGSPRALTIDSPFGQTATAFTFPKVKKGYFNAEEVPYIVLPGKASGRDFVGDFGIKPLDLGVVIAGGQVTPAFYGEVGPTFRIGEASIQVHENLPVKFPWTSSAKTHVRNASVPGEICYLIFPATAVARTPAMSAEGWLQATLNGAMDEFNKWVQSGG